MPSPSERAEKLVDALRADAAATDQEGGFPTASLDLLRISGLLRVAASRSATPTARSTC